MKPRESGGGVKTIWFSKLLGAPADGPIVKEDARKELLRVREAIPPAERAAQSKSIAEHLHKLRVVQQAVQVLGYRALPAEVDLEAFLSTLSNEGKAVCLPRVSKGHFEARRWAPGHVLEPGPFGIPQPAANAPLVHPETLDVVIIPGVGFDEQGDRLGFGKGYYDRYLRMATDAVRIGVCFRQQLRPKLPTGELDVRMDWVITADKAISTNAP